MATSSTYILTITALQMATAIARVLGVVDPEEPLSTNEVDNIIQAINFWLFQKKGPPHHLNPGQMMWTRETADLTLSSKADYDLKPSGGDLDIQIPVQILTATLKDSDGNETPLSFMTLEQYQEISLKTQEGDPTSIYYEKRIDTGKLCLDYVPSDTTKTIDIVYRQPLEIISANTDEFDIEDFWFRAIKFNVALDMAPEYLVYDPNQIGLIKSRADEAMLAIGSFYPETSDLYFQPGKD